jgi:hypothetical protein
LIGKDIVSEPVECIECGLLYHDVFSLMDSESLQIVDKIESLDHEFRLIQEEAQSSSSQSFSNTNHYHHTSSQRLLHTI